MRLPKAFGKYVLTEKIASGGMAEVFRAKTYGVGGFEKILAIKKIHPQYSANQQFITMLIDEAKINVVLSHANIVQVFDLGKIGEDYFIAMEFINGKDLHRILRKLKYKNARAPIDIAVFMISEACKGLDYAHKKKDSQGHPLGLVHRDVSPQNVLVSYEGEVKVVDFGIAKAGVQNKDTTGGVLKGKISYMSPEQARGDFIDHRSDIFALGAVFHEVLTGEQLFVGENDYYTLEAVRAARVKPPSVFRPEIPIELSKIVLRSLARESDDRYQEASQFHLDLTRFLYSRVPDFSSTRLAEFMKDLFARELEKTNVTGSAKKVDRMTRVDYVVARDQSLLAQETAAGVIQQTRPVIVREDSTKKVSSRPSAIEEPTTGKLSHTTPTREIDIPGPTERALTGVTGVVHRLSNVFSRAAWRDTGKLFVGRIEEFLSDLTPTGARVLVFSLILVIAFFASILVLLVRDTDVGVPPAGPAEVKPFTETRAEPPPPGSTWLPFTDNAAVLEKAVRQSEEDARAKTTAALEQTQHEQQDAVKPAKKGGAPRPKSPKPRPADDSATAGGGGPAQISVNAMPWGQVFVDGAMIKNETPLQNHELKSGRHEVRVFYPQLGRSSKPKWVTLRPGEHKKLVFKADED
ncbi:MAG: serine/threonine protein kinase [Deltaproteobacteria bacterium]|nr:serine/threonine protein kinase [Deltaproteobacteria bacterium]